MSAGSTSNFLSQCVVADFGRGRRPRIGMTGEVDHSKDGVGLHNTASRCRTHQVSLPHCCLTSNSTSSDRSFTCFEVRIASPFPECSWRIASSASLRVARQTPVSAMRKSSKVSTTGTDQPSRMSTLAGGRSLSLSWLHHWFSLQACDMQVSSPSLLHSAVRPAGQ